MPLLHPAQTCSNCQHYDGDHFCALDRPKRLVLGYIIDAENVVCAEHEFSEAYHQECIRKAIEADGIAYERSLYGFGRY
jgi:hypothetical protein